MRAHLVSSDDPLHEGGKLYAVCGACVENAIFQFFFRDDVSEFSLALNSLNTCPRCYGAQRFLTGHYVYGIVSARKSPHSDRAEEREAVSA